MLAPQNGGARTLTLGASGTTDLDTAYQVLTLAFSNQRSKLDSFESAIKKKLGDLIKAGGSALSNTDLTSLLVSTAKSFLTPENGFTGVVVNGVLNDVEPFLAKVISNIVQNQRGGSADTTPPPDQGNVPKPPQPNVPAGGMSFDVSGRIILTPSGGSTAPSGTGDNQNIPSGKNGQQQTIPTDLKTDAGGSAAPGIP
jgi:hypothetical protein